MPIRPSYQELKWLCSAATNKSQFRSFLRRSVRGEPLAYIIGSQPFGELDLRVRSPILIPRPETEEWAIRLSEVLTPSRLARSHPLSLLDLGTGTGCIPILLCHVWGGQGQVRACGVDINPDAVQLANENAASCGLSPETFKAVQGNFLSPNFLDGLQRNGVFAPPFDIVTSNPPYIPFHEFVELPKSVRAHEDPKALFGGPSGLEFYRALAELTSKHGFLSPGGLVVLEVGHNQAKSVRELMHNSGFITQVWRDAWQKERTIIARRVPV